jgi:hypothetical protein
MQQLTNAEEQLMEHLWAGESLYERFTQTFPEPNPNHYRCHFTETMIDKDFVAYTEFGNSENTIHW